MAQVRSWAGLDVHASTVVAATVDRESGELGVRRLSGRTGEVVAFCAGLAGPTLVAYEAGPTGFALARALEAAGVGCVVAAPGKIERPARDRVKTDRRDAERLVRLLMLDALHAVRVPSVQEEALRDLVRAREDVRGDLMRARHRLSKLLLRHDVRFDGTARAWTTRHRAWLGARGSRRPGAADADRLPGRHRRADRAPRHAGGPHRTARPGLAVGRAGRQVALPARDRHPVGGRAVR